MSSSGKIVTAGGDANDNQKEKENVARQIDYLTEFEQTIEIQNMILNQLPESLSQTSRDQVPQNNN